MRNINMIVVHCSATPPEMDIGVEEIRRWHTDPKPRGRGWSDIGYHIVIRRNGDIEHGRPISIAGAHAYGFNSNSIGICLIGGTDANDRSKAKANFTFEQYSSLCDAVHQYTRGYGIKHENILGHRDLPNVSKACPCFDVHHLLFGG